MKHNSLTYDARCQTASMDRTNEARMDYPRPVSYPQGSTAEQPTETRPVVVGTPLTGTTEGHLLQDMNSGLSKALERDPNARQLVRDAAAAITTGNGS